ncbi:MAG: sugar-binding protein [Planctomycetota bacterium]
MKKFALITLIVAAILLTALSLTAPAPISAQAFDGLVPPDVPGELIYIPFPVDITLDGDLADWGELPSYLVDDGPNLPDTPEENGSFTFSVAADRENLYITIQMPDVNIVAGQHGTEFWNEDSMEFYINASGDLGTRSYAPNIFQVNINAADIGNSDPDGLTLTGVNSGDHTVRGFVFKTADGWGMETAVPWS